MPYARCSVMLKLSTLTLPPSQDTAALWVKRDGVDCAQYDEIVARLGETVSQFKRRWLADKRLELDPGLVTLLLVRGAPPRHLPSETQEAQALLLANPALTLREAGVADGCWLLARLPPSQLTGPFCCSLLATIRLTRRTPRIRSNSSIAFLCSAFGTGRRRAALQGHPAPYGAALCAADKCSERCGRRCASVRDCKGAARNAHTSCVCSCSGYHCWQAAFSAARHLFDEYAAVRNARQWQNCRC